MSVAVRDRKLSKIESYKVASDQLAHTFKYADFKHFSKSDKDIVWKLRELAMEVLVNTVKALDIYPTCTADVEMRRHYFMEAIASNNALDSLLTAIKACSSQIQPTVIIRNISDFGWENWGILNDKENRLLKGHIEADKKIKFEKDRERSANTANFSNVNNDGNGNNNNANNNNGVVL